MNANIIEEESIEIPNGCYCYTIKKIIKDEKLGYILETKLCPYYVYLNNISTCLITGTTSEDNFLLDNQVKVCGINEECKGE